MEKQSGKDTDFQQEMCNMCFFSNTCTPKLLQFQHVHLNMQVLDLEVPLEVSEASSRVAHVVVQLEKLFI